MKFSVRQEVDLLNIAQSLGTACSPIELALPYKLPEFIEQQTHLPELQQFVTERGIEVLTVHATQGHFTDAAFHNWGLATVQFAEAVGASSVVFHPENCAKERKGNLQILALQNIRRLQRETSVTVAVETFGGPKRILTPEEIVQKELPMILDTSHLFEDRTLQLIDQYAHGIVGVHLSEERADEHPDQNGEKKPHQPVKEFAYAVLDRLVEKGWNGTVTLEYMPWWHHRLIPDYLALSERYGKSQ